MSRPVHRGAHRGVDRQSHRGFRVPHPSIQKPCEIDDGADVLAGHHLPPVLFQTHRERDPAAFGAARPGMHLDRTAGERGTGVVDRHADPDPGFARFEIRRHQLAAGRLDPKDHGDRRDRLYPGVAHRGGGVAAGRFKTPCGGDCGGNRAHLVA